ncbi:MAG: hypothetical protein Q8Q07_03345 [Dehalococcoidales bacterium]|nr:hypothetical protein [Dehalococcoidales bacterium]MDZ4230458.1 hypothetical protein [Dehalococcoidales bacterium]
MVEQSDRVGEIIEASTTDFTAQCYELYQSPPLGSLVKTTATAVELYGIVAQASTASIEPGRRPIARGRDETDEEAVYRQSPQLLKLLRTEFNALVVGYREDGKLYRYLPPRPARIHGFVYPCSTEEVRDFSQSFSFLNILLNTHLPVPVEELAAAALRRMSQVHEAPTPFLVAAGKELAILLGGEFGRLKAILGRLQP